LIIDFIRVFIVKSNSSLLHLYYSFKYMFFKLFKKKSNDKYLNNILNNRKSSVNNNKIKSVGIIINLEEFNDYDSLRNVFTYLGVNENKIKFVAYVTEKDETLTSWDSYFTPLDFGWNGNISNYDINEFIETEFDALISYYDENIHELNLITAKSKANFKIGISNKDQRLHDFIINIKSSFIDIFKVELEKYLKGLKKI
ncbi:MAG: hypothetical protein P8H49_05005, partial [Flavobacteriaceae bacterium]|nr:hypothetical protein [Flavobacteriaceae bacterium]